MAVKLVDVFARKDGWTYEEFRDYLHDEHAELIEQLPNLKRYTLSVPETLDGYETAIPKRPAEYDYDGIVELYFESVEDLFDAFRSEAGSELQSDVSTFLDGDAGPTFVMREESVSLEDGDDDS
jgi:uncharacterized protein (TIGR02118 family)